MEIEQRIGVESGNLFLYGHLTLFRAYFRTTKNKNKKWFPFLPLIFEDSRDMNSQLQQKGHRSEKQDLNYVNIKIVCNCLNCFKICFLHQSI